MELGSTDNPTPEKEDGVAISKRTRGNSQNDHSNLKVYNSNDDEEKNFGSSNDGDGDNDYSRGGNNNGGIIVMTTPLLS